MGTAMVTFLSLLPGIADNLRALTWVSYLSADEITIVVKDINEELVNQQMRQCKKGDETHVNWEAEGQALLDLGGAPSGFLAGLNELYKCARAAADRRLIEEAAAQQDADNTSGQP